MKKKNKLKILYEDKYLIAVYKDSRIPTIKSDNYKYNLYSQVYDYLHKKNQCVFVVHRLDADTSGIVLFAKSENIKNNLQDNWNNVYREYIALVHGVVKDEDIIKSYIKETKTLYSYSSSDNNGKLSITHYKKIKSNGLCSLLRIDIKTGRKNQIRVHMKDNNTPILGDRKYGVKDGFRNMMLMHNKIVFYHPILKKQMTIELEIPSNYLSVIGDNNE